MRKWLLLWWAAAVLQAAVIRGVVVENQTGRPLARALVTAQPVAGTAGAPVSVRTNVYGAFEFPPLTAGAYLVSASRRSFAPLEYGQKRWKAAGVPIVLDASGTAALTLRLQRFGSITGAVVDENDVGLPEHEVMAYRNTRPPQLAAHAVTDDRGMYRLWGLEPGSYYVRTAAKKGEEDSYLPTFARETTRVDEARPVDVEFDRQNEEVSVRPFPGRLALVLGQALVTPPGVITVTMVSDMGSQSTMTDGGGNFHFDSVAPGQYELYAQSPAGTRGGLQAAYAPLLVDRERIEPRLRLGALTDLQIVVEDTKGQPVDFTLFQVRARKKDLAGEGAPQTLRPTRGHAALTPGRWDLEVTPTAGYYVARFSVLQTETAARSRADGWNEITAAGGTLVVQFVLSSNPGVVRGVVNGTNGQPVAGAPVYLEPYDAQARKRVGDPRVAHTDLQGKYQFYGLPPGEYRILGTFEYQLPDAGAMDAAGARIVRVEEARETAVDMELYVLR
jgi:protocatechuate 3,4-dioxygenase beta subunit